MESVLSVAELKISMGVPEVCVALLLRNEVKKLSACFVGTCYVVTFAGDSGWSDCNFLNEARVKTYAVGNYNHKHRG